MSDNIRQYLYDSILDDIDKDPMFYAELISDYFLFLEKIIDKSDLINIFEKNVKESINEKGYKF